MTDLKWQDPPQAEKGRGARGKWVAVLEQLRARPGEWAIVHVGSGGTATQLKKGQMVGVPAGALETAMRKRADGKFDVYARYVGDEVAS